MRNLESLVYSRKGIVVDKGPLSRAAYLKKQLTSEGLAGIKEDKRAAYCAIPLTSAPVEIQPLISQRQEILLDILKEAGLTGYDPKTAPYSPDKGLTIKPDEVSRVDTAKIASARFFTLLDLLPSTGVGVEERTAYDYNRIAVILHDREIRNSRMQPSRAIHLQYDDLDQQRDQLVQVFRLLQLCEPGTGFDNRVPVLLGFRGLKAYNLEKLVYELFPDLKYEYDPDKPTLEFLTVNPGLLLPRLTSEQVIQYKTKNVADIYDGLHDKDYITWNLIDTNREDLKPTLILAVFSYADGSDLFYARFTPDGLDQVSLMEHRKIANRIVLPEKILQKEKEFYNLTPFKATQYFRNTPLVLSSSPMPAALIIFDQPDGSEPRATQIVSPNYFPPSAVLEYIKQNTTIDD